MALRVFAAVLIAAALAVVVSAIADRGDDGSSSPTHEVLVVAEPSLRFNADQYQTRAGNVRLKFLSAGGTHVLNVDAPGLRRLGMKAPASGRKAPRFTQDGAPYVLGAGFAKPVVVTLKPGVYHVFCSIPGHRAAGMDSVLAVK